MSAEWKVILQMVGLMAVVLVGYGLYILYQKRKSRQMLIARIRSDWGAWPQREYDYRDWENAQGYYCNKECSEFQIDDITWEDLDLSRVFMLLNHTGSYIGEGYLYYLLRTPSFSKEELDERERLVEYFTEHEAEREQVQELFWKTGKAGRNLIFDAIYNLREANPGSVHHHYLMGGLFLASIAVLFVFPMQGVLLLIAAMFISMNDYYRKKRPIEQFVASCAFLLRTLDMAEILGKMDIPEIRSYQEKILEARKAFGKLRRNSFFLMTGARTDGDLMVGIIMYLNSCFHIDLIQFSTIVEEMKLHIGELETLVEEMGKIEAAIAIGSFRTCMGQQGQDWCLPGLNFDRHGQKLEAENLYHPLIGEPVKNSIRAGRGVLITGSNASGKSTFLKTVALNAVLAQTVHTCLADCWKSDCFRVYSSMSLKDNLEGQESYYMVEIRSLKRMLDQIHREESYSVLCFVDEVLRGTNTVERIAASAQVLEYMTGSGVLCFAATHDIELTHILEHYYDNYHFQEEVEANDIHFDYRIYPGRATSRNAIKLLQIMGYDQKVIDEAEAEAKHFLETGEWKVSV